MNFEKWLDTFVEEKRLANKQFTITHAGMPHYIDTEFIIELCKKASVKEKKFIKDTIVKIDFVNGDINHFLEHLASCYIRENFQ